MLDAHQRNARAEAARLRTAPAPIFSSSPYVPAHPAYPLRRRAARLSYSIWLVLREPGLELQPLLDAPSTAERLRAVLRRLRVMVERLGDEPYKEFFRG